MCQSVALRQHYDGLLASAGLNSEVWPRQVPVDHRHEQLLLYKESVFREAHHVDEQLRLIQQWSYPNGSNSLQWYFDDIAVAMERAANELGLALPRKVFVGEWPSGTMFAQAQLLDEGVLILTSLGLCQAIHQIAKTYARAQSFRRCDSHGKAVPHSAFGQRGWGIDNCAQSLMNIALAYYIDDDLTKAPVHPPLAGLRAWFHKHLLVAAEDFVVAHELAHVIRDDFETCQSGEASPLHLPFMDYSHLHQIEYAADEIALRMVLAVEERYCRDPDEIRFRIAGVMLLFGIAHLLDTVGAECFSRTPFSHVTYPSPVQRLQNIRSFAVRLRGNDSVRNGDACIQWIMSFAPEAAKRARSVIDAARRISVGHEQ